MSQVRESLVFRELADFPVGKIYYIGSSHEVQMGFNFFHNGNVTEFSWNKSNTILQSVVNDRYSNNTVEFFIDSDRLSYDCDCWNDSGGCRHIISSILTVKGILTPTIMKPSRINCKKLSHLKDMLTRPIKHSMENPEKRKPAHFVESIIRVVLEPYPYLRDNFRVNIYQHKKCLPYNSRAIPGDLTLLAEQASLGYMSEEQIINVFNISVLHYPVEIELDKSPTQLFWDSNLSFNSRTVLEAGKKNITLNKLCYNEGLNPEDVTCIGSRLVADIKGKRLGTIAPDDGWTLWESIATLGRFHKYMTSNSTMRIPKKRFDQIQICYEQRFRKEFMESVIFQTGTEKFKPQPGKPEYRLTILPDKKKENQFKVKAEIVVNGKIFHPTQNIFAFLQLTERTIKHKLKSRKNKKIMVTAFLEILGKDTREEAKEVISRAVKNSALSICDLNSAAEEVFYKFLNIVFTSFERVIEVDGRWAVIPGDKRERLLFTIPYRMLGIDIFLNMPDFNEATVEKETLFESIHKLKKQLNDKQIDFFLEEKRVVAPGWEFAIDATGKKSIDWFEVTPEIRCDGKVVPLEKCLKALTQNGFSGNPDEFAVLDPKSRKLLQAFAGIIKKQDKSKRSKKIFHLSRLQILDWIYMKKSGVKLKLLEKEEQLIEKLINFTSIEKKKIPSGLSGELREYQKEGYFWLSFLYEHRFGACLADDMGLGKTVQTITLLGGLREGIIKTEDPFKNRPHLIVVPPSLIFNWHNELEKFYPSMEVEEYTGKKRVLGKNKPDIILTTYDIARRDIDKLKNLDFNVMVFDEAQAVKNIYASRTSAVRQLKGAFKLAITGTPVENHLGEYYSIMDLCVPGLLDDYDSFQKVSANVNKENYQRVIHRTRPFVLRRTKDKILKDLPKKQESYVYLNLTEQQKDLYTNMVKMVKTRIDTAYATKTSGQAKIIALTAILRLRQICVHPAIIDPSFKEESPKITYLIDKLKELQREGHSVLVFSQFTSFLDLLESEIKKHDINFLRMDGKTPLKKRKNIVGAFQHSPKNTPLTFIMSLKTGGIGLNLTRASYVFHLDPWWNPAVENQANDRTHRIGQKNKVFITRIIMHHTVEEKMIELKKKKQALYDVIMNSGMERSGNSGITKEDFDYLFS